MNPYPPENARLFNLIKLRPGAPFASLSVYLGAARRRTD
jgi:hypothetical protein